MFQFIKEQFEQATSKVRQTDERKVNLYDTEYKCNSNFESGIYAKYIKNKVLNQLNQFIGKKVLMIDQYVGEMLNLVVESVTLLKENGVEEIYYIDSDSLEVEQNQIIFFVSPDRQFMKRIVRIIRNNQLQQQSKKYMLILCPRANIICKDYLEKEAVKGDLILMNFNFDLIQLQSDLLSLELNGFIRATLLNNDLSPLHIIAESIQRMELVHGKFKNIYSKGSQAKNVIEILQQKQNINQDDENGFQKSKLHTLLLVDRKIDWITPMLTPFTYEALIDELFGIKQNQINLETIGNEKILKDRSKMLKLNDPIYHSIKNLNIKLASRILEQKRQQNKQLLQQLKQQEGQISMSEMNQYIQKVRTLPKEQNQILDHLIVSSHINGVMEEILFNLCINQEVNAILQTKTQQIEQTIDNLIQMQVPIQKVIRMLILYCQTQNQIKGKFYDYIRREIIHVYGLEHMVTLRNCERLGLIGTKISETNIWEKVEKGLRLINENIDHDCPEDFSYVYLAYAPIIVRLFEEILVKNNWNGIMQGVKDLSGETVIQQNLNQLAGIENNEEQEQCYVIYFIGGVTYGEIAAIRWLQQRYQKDIIICTTHIISGNKLVDSMMQC